MTPKSILFDAINGKQPDRIPWVPFVGCHAAYLINESVKNYMVDSDKIVEGISVAIDSYQPDGIPVIFDLQIEAEALGCKLKWVDDNPPSVIYHPLSEGAVLNDLKIPTEKDGRFPVVLDAMKKLKAGFGNEIAFYGLITGPFTLALHLLGTSIFFKMKKEVEYVQQVISFCKEVGKKTAQMYIEAGMDVIAVVDPMTSQISPRHFRQFVTDPVTEIFDYVKEQGVYASFFVCGDAKPNIEEMCKCKPHNLSIDENIPLDYVKEICERYGISFGGNMKLTTVLLLSTPDKCKQHALDCMNIGGKKGYILAPGCDIPFDVPKENLQAVAEVVHHKDVYDMMEIVVEEEEDIYVEMPDYKNDSAVHIEIFTLDSKSCAPCQYMVNSAYNAISSGIKEKIVFKEYKIKERESIARMKKLGVTSIPSITIDGEIKYKSITPPSEELREQILKAVEMKGRK